MTDINTGSGCSLSDRKPMLHVCFIEPIRKQKRRKETIVSKHLTICQSCPHHGLPALQQFTSGSGTNPLRYGDGGRGVWVGCDFMVLSRQTCHAKAAWLCYQSRCSSLSIRILQNWFITKHMTYHHCRCTGIIIPSANGGDSVDSRILLPLLWVKSFNALANVHLKTC